MLEAEPKSQEAEKETQLHTKHTGTNKGSMKHIDTSKEKQPSSRRTLGLFKQAGMRKVLEVANFEGAPAKI